MKSGATLGLLLAVIIGTTASPASLRVRWSNDPAGLDRIALIPVDIDLPAGLTRVEAIEKWTRPVAESSWSNVPAGTYQIVLRGGSVPMDVAEVVLTADDDRTVTLAAPAAQLNKSARKPGAAIVVRVRSGRDARPLEGVRVSAVRAHELSTMRGELQLDRAAVASGTSDEAGWVRLEGLPQERVVFVFRPSTRTQPQLSEPYVFRADEEAVLDDVMIDPPSAVLVTVSMKDDLAKAIELHGVELVPDGHNHWPAGVPLRGEIANGNAVIKDVPPGTWSIQVTGRLKGGFVVRAARQKVDVLAGIDAHVTLTVDDTLYRGVVTRGGVPFEGVINLKPADRRAGTRGAVARSGADGTFRVLLEKEGAYSVHVQETATGAGAKLGRHVQFDDSDEEVEIELPVGRIRGRVLNAGGTPVAHAVVTATAQVADPAGQAYARNVADGTFVIEHVEAGTWEVSASTKEGRSEPVRVIAGSGDVEGITLLVEPVKTVKVRVVDSTGTPVREAIVVAEFPQAAPARPQHMVRMTGADGTTELRLTRAQMETPVNVHVAAGARDVRLACAIRQLDADQTIALPAQAGELRLAGVPSTLAPGGHRWLVSSSGCSVPFLGTRRERDISGADAIVFPQLPAGRWSYVETRSSDELTAILTGRVARLVPIATFIVGAGTSTRVDLTQRK